ncbi:MAG: hypothetical protein GX609_05335 [Actinomycetales bacterium]|nr:hypothetical protein [Actinomycetales bacterium]
MRLWVLRNRLRALFGLAPVPPRRGEPVPPVPRVEPSLGRTLPGALVRLAPAAVVPAVAALAGCRDGWWVLAGVAAVAVVGWPRQPVVMTYLAVAALWLVGDGDALLADPTTGSVPGVARVAGLVLAVHVLLVATTLAAHVEWGSLVEVAVLVRAARGALAAQAVAQSAVLLVAWVRAGIVGRLDVLRGVAVLAVVAAALVAVPREWFERRPRPPRD